MIVDRDASVSTLEELQMAYLSEDNKIAAWITQCLINWSDRLTEYELEEVADVASAGYESVLYETETTEEYEMEGWKRDAWHNKYDLLFRKIVQALKLSQGQYEIRHIKNSPFYLGEIELHTPKLLVIIAGHRNCGEGGVFSFRRVNGLDDYKGGGLNWLPLEDFHKPAKILAEFKRVMGEG